MYLFFPFLEYPDFLLEEKLNEINDLHVIPSTKYNYE